MEFIIAGHVVKTYSTGKKTVRLSIDDENLGEADTVQDAIDIAKDFIKRYNPAPPKHED
jgi:hypothetical protein